jgi:hypothetical protein
MRMPYLIFVRLPGRMARSAAPEDAGRHRPGLDLGVVAGQEGVCRGWRSTG